VATHFAALAKVDSQTHGSLTVILLADFKFDLGSTESRSTISNLLPFLSSPV
jgi:hypothetical protein